MMKNWMFLIITCFASINLWAQENSGLALRKEMLQKSGVSNVDSAFNAMYSKEIQAEKENNKINIPVENKTNTIPAEDQARRDAFIVEQNKTNFLKRLLQPSAEQALADEVQNATIVADLIKSGFTVIVYNEQNLPKEHQLYVELMEGNKLLITCDNSQIIGAYNAAGRNFRINDLTYRNDEGMYKLSEQIMYDLAHVEYIIPLAQAGYYELYNGLGELKFKIKK
jgi:hypothetical protein